MPPGEERKNKRLIGFWAQKKRYRSNKNLLPRASEFVDKTFDPILKELILSYIELETKSANFSKGMSNCRFCKKMIGSYDLTDGEYLFPIGYIHYIEFHNVVPPLRFIRKVKKYYKEKR